MISKHERIKGKLEEMGGAIQKMVGKVFAIEMLQARGQARQNWGVARQEAAKAAQRRKGTAQEIKGAVESFVGKVVGNEKMQVGGAVDKISGAARIALNREVGDPALATTRPR